MTTIVQRNQERGAGEYGWLSTRYSFSFADWYDPSRMGFGALRVLNDDRIAPARGFGAHQHADMEIITIVMKGAVTHEDSMGNKGAVEAGEVQVMSAGTGVVHAERNDSADEPLELFQLWIMPSVRGVAPRYEQRSFREEVGRNGVTLLASPEGKGGLMMNQDAYVSLIRIPAGASGEYALHDPAHGTYVFVIEGACRISGEELAMRDALGATDASILRIDADEDTLLLAIEVPV